MDNADELRLFVFVPSFSPDEPSDGAIIILDSTTFLTVHSKDSLRQLLERYPEDLTPSDLPLLEAALANQPLQEVNPGQFDSFRVGGNAGDVLLDALELYVGSPADLLAIQRKFEGCYYVDFYDCSGRNVNKQPVGLLRLDETVSLVFSKEQGCDLVSQHASSIEEALLSSLRVKINSSGLPDTISTSEGRRFTISGMVGSLFALALFHFMNTVILEEREITTSSEAN